MSMAGDTFPEFAIIYTGCQLCDHEAEFYGVVVDDVAYFPCSNCQTVFELGTCGGWSGFFDDENDIEDPDDPNAERDYFDRFDV